MDPVLTRLGEVCIVLEIVKQDPGTPAFYEHLIKTTLRELNTAWRVEGLRLSGGDQLEGNQGGWYSINQRVVRWKKRIEQSEPPSSKKPRWLESAADDLVYRLHGYVKEKSSGRWVLPGPELVNFHTFTHQLGFILSERIRHWIREQESQRPDVMRRYLNAVSDYFRAEARRLPRPPWNETREFHRGHEFIPSFLTAIHDTQSEIFLVAVDLYITASLGRRSLLEKLEDGKRVRVLIFDFVNGDANLVARRVGRSRTVLSALCSDTVEALDWIRTRLTPAKSAGLDIKVTRNDPLGRWYFIDADGAYRPTTRAFFVKRGTEKASDSSGKFTPEPNVIEPEYSAATQLWVQPEPINAPFDSWVANDYAKWKNDDDGKAVLGTA